MLAISRRFYSSAAPSASSVASSFLKTTQSLPPQVQTQTIDSNQLQRLSATLSRGMLHPSLSIETSPPPASTALPAGYHLAYFTPSQREDQLGRDGTDTTFNPPSPFTRRMWAGGELRWTGKENLLKVGQDVTETTKLVSAEGKVTRKGEEMVVVGVKKTFENEKGLALFDRRNWIFRRALPDNSPSTPEPQPLLTRPPVKPNTYTRDFTQTPISLFHFSAITFNAHLIHLSKEWCRDVEGHRTLVVHGPLNLINMLDFWRDARQAEEGVVPKSISYRATSPLYEGEPYTIEMGEEREKVVEVRIVDWCGNVAMTGRIEAF